MFREKSTAVRILWHKFGGEGKYTPPSTAPLPPGIGLKSFWGIYTHAEHLRVWILHGDWLNDTRHIIVSFCIFS